MTETTTARASVAPGPFFIVGVVFLVLRLCGVISWPWLWVLAPFWLPLAIGLGLVAIFFVVGFIVALAKKARR